MKPKIKTEEAGQGVGVGWISFRYLTRFKLIRKKM